MQSLFWVTVSPAKTQGLSSEEELPDSGEQKTWLFCVPAPGIEGKEEKYLWVELQNLSSNPTFAIPYAA